jgi:hypothetical protein
VLVLGGSCKVKQQSITQHRMSSLEVVDDVGRSSYLNDTVNRGIFLTVLFSRFLRIQDKSQN